LGIRPAWANYDREVNSPSSVLLMRIRHRGEAQIAQKSVIAGFGSADARRGRSAFRSVAAKVDVLGDELLEAAARSIAAQARPASRQRQLSRTGHRNPAIARRCIHAVTSLRSNSSSNSPVPCPPPTEDGTRQAD